MIKKLSKMLVLTLMCTMIFMRTAHAGAESYTFMLANTGTTYKNYSKSTNVKTILSNDWTMYVQSITAPGPYGISFCPVQCTSSRSVVKKCTSSARWIKTIGYAQTPYASGDAKLTRYMLGARQDDDYNSSFNSKGLWNADVIKY